ncbi:MAG TPA: hypothetical protein VFC86_01265, partial [Planctomycetota bacterium]|nr:hypothetical protein [Planctomycetota bacterium]
MLEFSCDCGRKLKVSNDLAGWQTQCPGCQKLIDVPSPEAAPMPVAAAPKASVAIPWMGIAIGSSSVAVILLIILIATSGGSKAAGDEDTERRVSNLKKQLADRDEELETLNAELAKYGAPSKLSERAKAAEAERDRLRGQLDATTRLLDEARLKLAQAEKGQAPPARGEKPIPPAEPSKNPAPPALAGDVAEKCAPAVVLVTSDTDSGGGCFVAADGLVL